MQIEERISSGRAHWECPRAWQEQAGHHGGLSPRAGRQGRPDRRRAGVARGVPVVSTQPLSCMPTPCFPLAHPLRSVTGTFYSRGDSGGTRAVSAPRCSGHSQSMPRCQAGCWLSPICCRNGFSEILVAAGSRAGQAAVWPNRPTGPPGPQHECQP